MSPRKITEEMVHAARASITQKQLMALIEIVEKAPDYRRGIVSHWSIDKRHANALARRGLVTVHTVPHKGHKPTELGQRVRDSVR